MSSRAKRFAFGVLGVAAAATVVAMVLLWPGDVVTDPGQGPEQVDGVVVTVQPVPCPPAAQPDPAATTAGTARVCGTVTVRLNEGSDKGQQIRTDIPAGPGAPKIRAGDRVVLIHTTGSLSGLDYQISDHQRDLQLWVLGAIFAAAVIGFGRLRGLAALVGLGVTFAVLLGFIVPAILTGQSPLLVAIVGAAAIMLSVLYLTHGFTMATSVAVLGTLASLTLTGLLAALATAALHLTGVATEEDNFLTIAYHNVNMQGLLLAGIIIGSLGVLDDVAVTQAVTVTELAGANNALSAMQLYRAGSRVGRAHIASVINTIILAYAGASLPLLLLITAGGQPLGQVLTTQAMTQEFVRSIVGTVGLIAAVPITTGLAALTARRIPAGRPPTAERPNRPRPVPTDALATGWLDDNHNESAWPGHPPKY